MAEFRFFENSRALKSYKDSAFEFLSENASDLLDCYFFPSSGSEGKKKWIALSEEALRSSAIEVNRWINATAEDVFLLSLPLFHVGGFSLKYRAELLGAECVPMNFSKWSPEAFAEQIKKDKITVCSLVPTQVFDLINSKLRAPSCLRVAFVGGGALSEALYNRGRELGWPLLPTFGMTEIASQVATTKLESLNTLDFPSLYLLPHLRASTDKESRLTIAGRSLAKASLLLDGEKWNLEYFDSHNGLVTNDFVSLHKEEESWRLDFLGRDSDRLKIAGELSSLMKLQSVLDEILMSMQLCQKFAVMDLADLRLGQKLVLVYETGVDQHTVQKVESSFNQRVLPFEKIRSCVQVESLPRSDLGKLLRPKLRKILETREIK